MKKYIFTIVAFLLAFTFLSAGLNKFLNFAQTPGLPTDEVVIYMKQLFSAQFMVVTVGVFEILGAVFILFRKLRILGLMTLLPSMTEILSMHLSFGYIGNGLWIVSSILFMTVCFFEKNRIAKVFQSITV